MKVLSVENALNRAAALCSRSEQAEGDIRNKLASLGLSRADADYVISRLIEGNFIDENRYAHAFVHDKLAYNGWGRLKIAYQLKLKGISSVAIAEAMEQIDETQYRNTLERLLRAKWREVSGRELQHARAAMLRFGASRGFEPSMLYDMVDAVIDYHETED